LPQWGQIVLNGDWQEGWLLLDEIGIVEEKDHTRRNRKDASCEECEELASDRKRIGVKRRGNMRISCLLNNVSHATSLSRLLRFASVE